MRLLLDTHVLLWWFADDRRLGSRARALIGNPAHDVLVSVVALWEVALKLRVGKLRADIAEIGNAIGREGFLLLPIEVSHLLALASLPAHHRDPFDHLLIAQAIVENADLMTEDRYASRYPVRVMSCTDTGMPG